MQKLYFSLFMMFITIIIYPQWVQTNGPNANKIFSIVGSGTRLFAGSFGDGVFRTTDNGDSWIPINSGLSSVQITSLAIGSDGSSLIAGTWGGVFRSTDNGNSWAQVDSGLQPYMAVNALIRSNMNLYAGTIDKGIFLSTNNGISWTAIYKDTLRWITSFAFIGQKFFAGASWGGGLLCFTNNNSSWTVDTLLKSNSVFSLGVGGGNLLAGTGDGILLSTDYGINWTAINTGPLQNHNVRSFSANSTNLFAGTTSGVFLSTDDGITWSEVSDALTDSYVHSLAVCGTNLLAGTESSGIWKRPLSELVPIELTSFTATVNGKEVTLSWSTATELNNQGFEVQRKFGSNDFVTIGLVKGHGTTTSPNNYTYVEKPTDAGKYFYRLKQIDFNGTSEYSNEIEIEVRVLDKFTLEQNYPNPFNPSTKIAFDIPLLGGARGGLISLKVYDILGNEVATLVDEFRSAGNYEVEFDGGKLSSGLYIYTLNSGNYFSSRKMMLLK
jgi:hypothetical protein